MFIKFAEAKLSLLSGLLSGIGPEDFVLGRAKCATGTSSLGVPVETVALVVLVRAALSDMDGITKLVRIECADERRECRGISWNSATPESERLLGGSMFDTLALFALGG